MKESTAAQPMPHAYYEQPTLAIARDLLGKTLWHTDDDGIVGGIIVETEAYISAIDPASHNHRKPAKRSMTMFGPPGHAYIYLTYGMHHCLNVVTEPEGTSAAVLIRAVAPVTGREHMAMRCPRCAVRDLGKGPGRLCQAFGLSTVQNGLALTGDTLWISETPDTEPLDPARIATSPRIGISQGIDLPWRFFIREHPAVSGPAWLNRGQPRPSTVAPSRANSDQNAG